MTARQSTPALIESHEPPLSAPLRFSFDYTRSVGSTLSAFFTALRARHILGVRTSDGRVLVPPAEITHVQQIASKLEKMPPKSTFFYPKLLTGLVFNSLG